MPHLVRFKGMMTGENGSEAASLMIAKKIQLKSGPADRGWHSLRRRAPACFEPSSSPPQTFAS
jgi:hypothetical protein